MTESVTALEDAKEVAAGPVPSGIRELSRDARAQAQALARITGEQDVVLRNLLITQSYHELSRGLSEVVDAKNVNWSTFATWASKTAGRSIRNEEVPSFVMDALRFSDRLDALLPTWLRAVLEHVGILHRVRAAARRTLQEVSAEVSEGNLKVYSELGPLFEHFIDALRAGAAPGPQPGEALERFFEKLRPGAPESEGQDLLREAFGNYVAARQSSSDEERAELMLLANCRIGLHEQTRLQPNIQKAMDAPIEEIFVKYLKVTLPLLIRGPAAFLIKYLVRHFTREVTELWQELATRHAMNLALPEGKEIPLGSDVPSLPSGVPVALENLELPELRELFARFHASPSSNAGSGANNWARLEDRMGFIVELFRTRQQDLELLSPPFDAAQRAELERGVVPSGAL